MKKIHSSYFPVGRLDCNSSGLLILTNDGDLAQKLSHPRYETERVYRVKVRGEVQSNTLKRIYRGVRLQDGLARGSANLVKKAPKVCWLELTVREGRNHLVRRLMEKLGHPVVKLQRLSHGPFKLGKLKIGEIRQLSEGQYQRARKIVMER